MCISIDSSIPSTVYRFASWLLLCNAVYSSTINTKFNCWNTNNCSIGVNTLQNTLCNFIIWIIEMGHKDNFITYIKVQINAFIACAGKIVFCQGQSYDVIRLSICI